MTGEGTGRSRSSRRDAKICTPPDSQLKEDRPHLVGGNSSAVASVNICLAALGECSAVVVDKSAGGSF
jgi:hypothetical protein